MAPNISDIEQKIQTMPEKKTQSVSSTSTGILLLAGYTATR